MTFPQQVSGSAWPVVRTSGVERLEHFTRLDRSRSAPPPLDVEVWIRSGHVAVARGREVEDFRDSG